MQESNPAKSLHTILCKAQKLSSADPLKRSVPYKNTWQKVFGYKKDEEISIIELYDKIYIVLDLYKKTRSLVESSTRLDVQKSTKFLDQISNGLFHINLEGNMDNFTKYINEANLVALDYMADAICQEANFREDALTDEEIEHLISEINSLEKDIKDSSLPPDIQKIISNDLWLIKNSLCNYKFYGLEGIRSALEQNIGSLLMNEEKIKKEKGDTTVSKFLNFILKIKTFFDTANSGVSLILPIINRLLNHPDK